MRMAWLHALDQSWFQPALLCRALRVEEADMTTNKVMLIDRNTLIGTGYSWCKNCGALQNRNTNAVWQSPVGFEK
jgi:hypothetical protein